MISPMTFNFVKMSQDRFKVSVPEYCMIRSENQNTLLVLEYVLVLAFLRIINLAKSYQVKPGQPICFSSLDSFTRDNWTTL